jgi:hypothetical protein
VIARFRREERILAALDHPNIARLLDAGVTDAGLPFLVMELIEGFAIDDHARRERLPLRERVRLFLDVCAAVHYAHGRQVIHRDLKPSNILVDRGGAAKLLDFGIAKLLETADPLAASTLTMHGHMTPEYASPEQIRGRALTPATDVFSLGIVLCELLSGARPFASVSRQPEEVVRAVLEGRPQRPSALVRRSTADAAQAAELEAEIRRGLDAVVLQALRAEPAERYPSVAALAADLERWLEGEAVRARPEPLALRAGRLLRGRRTAVLGVAGLTLALVAAGAALPAWRARRERDLREAAQRELLESRRRAGLVLAGVDESLASLPHEAVARALVLHAAARDLTLLEDRRAPEDPALARRLAVAWERVAELQPPGAASLEARRGAAARAEALARSLVEADPRDADAQRLLARLRERRAAIEADAASAPAARRTAAEPPP